MNIISSIPLPQHLPFTTTHLIPQQGMYLLYDSTGLSLCHVGEKGRVQVDFTRGASAHRRTQGGGELIAKAVNHKTHPTVWDATGGLGRDAFVLASLDLNLCVFEQNPTVFALLQDGVIRALSDESVAEIVARITLIQDDAVIALPQRATQYGKPDVIYLDPMYPQRQKSAAVKKEMAYFHTLVAQSNQQNDCALLSMAQQNAQKRIVVKRPRLGEYLANQKPAYQYIGKSTRFDVYLPLA